MVEEISPEELNRRLSNGTDLQVVDVRPPDAFRAGHIPGAINVPLGDFVAQVPERQWADEIVLVCPHGQSSRQAGRLLESYEGIGSAVRIANLTGGYDEWLYELEPSGATDDMSTDSA